MTGGPFGGANLKDTAGIRGDDDVGVRRGDVRSLAPAERAGHLGLNEVEDAGAAAADVVSASGTSVMPGIDPRSSRGSRRTP